MSRMDPGHGCLDFAFSRAYTMSEAAEAALEDYARALAGSPAAEAITAEGGAVDGVHLCGAGQDADALLRAELEEFARELAARSGGAPLGWE